MYFQIIKEKYREQINLLFFLYIYPLFDIYILLVLIHIPFFLEQLAGSKI